MIWFKWLTLYGWLLNAANVAINGIRTMLPLEGVHERPEPVKNMEHAALDDQESTHWHILRKLVQFPF